MPGVEASAPGARSVPGLAWLGALAELGKLPISAMVTVTTATGYLLFARQWTWEIWTCVVGTFLLAAAASAFNQIQEQPFDAIMHRTRQRPLPSGRVDRGSAFFLGLIWTGLGLAALASAPAQPMLAMGLGLIAMVWYNGVYTYLKRRTAFAGVPGAAIGSIPPVIGWVAAGGSIQNPVILLVAGFFFVWQVPHFWLLALRHGRDYSRAGLPTLTDLLAVDQIGRMTFAWIVATATAGLVLGGMLRMDGALLAGLLAASLWLGVSTRRLMGPVAAPASLKKSFGRINGYALLVCGLVVIHSVAH